MFAEVSTLRTLRFRTYRHGALKIELAEQLPFRMQPFHPSAKTAVHDFVAGISSTMGILPAREIRILLSQIRPSQLPLLRR
jgi:hypothetical protein